MPKEKVNGENTVQAVKELFSNFYPQEFKYRLDNLFYHYCTHGETDLSSRQDIGFLYTVLSDFFEKCSDLDLLEELDGVKDLYDQELVDN